MAAKVADSEPPILVESVVVNDTKLEPEVEESGLEVVELTPLQEEISSRLTEVEVLPIETLEDFLIEPTMELVSSLTVMRASLSLRSSDFYDSLQIFLQETRSQEIWLSWCKVQSVQFSS